MSRVATCGAWMAIALAVLGSHAALSQEVRFEETRTLGDDVPIAVRTLNVPQAGTYELALTDLAQPAPLSSVTVAVTHRGTMLARRDSAGTLQFDVPTSAAPIEVRILGRPAPAAHSGLVGVTVKLSGATTPFVEFVEPLVALPAPTLTNRAIVDETLAIATAGRYTLTLRDLAFPQVLQTLTLAVTREGGATLLLRLDAAGSGSFDAVPGNYRIFAIGESPAASPAGLYSVLVRADSTGSIVLDLAQPIGQVTLLGTPVLASAEHVLTFTDFSFPAALAQGGAIALHDGAAAARATPAASASFVAAAGGHAVFALATPDAGGTGSYGVELRRTGGAAALSIVRAVASPTAATPAFLYEINVASTGDYRLRLADFRLPGAFSSLAVAVAQGRTLVGSRDGEGSLNVSLASGEPVSIVVLAAPAQAAGLFGVDLLPLAGGATAFETTQGVGGLFQSRRVTIDVAGRYVLRLADLEFPTRFAELAAAATRGPERLGLIVGAGQFDFTATPGDYFVSFLAQPDGTARAGTYHLAVSSVPPAPVVSLSAAPASVTSGTTSVLSWNATNSTGCTASGAWSGARPASGSENTPALTASATFTLTCSGPGGSAAQSVTVGIAAQGGGGGGGGGGSFPGSLLVLLALVAAWRMRSRAYATRIG